jgi:hypothetical protein
MSAMSGRQVDALYGIRMSVPRGAEVLDVRPVLRGWWQVTAPDGRMWMIDEVGDVGSERVAA